MLFKKENSFNVDSYDEKKLSINYLTLAFLLLLLFAWCDDLFRFASSMLSNGKVPYPQICTILGAVLFVLALLFIRKKIHIEKPGFQHIDVIALALGVIYYLLKLPYFENMFDTAYYELWVQNNAFVNHATQGDLFFLDKAYLYALGDRVFYYFRMIFGYRLSTLVNLLIYFVSYYQLKQILYYFGEHFGFNLNRQEKKITLKGSIIPVISAMILLCEYFIVGMYVIKIDLFIVPIMLEYIRILFCKKDLSFTCFVYLGVLSGFGIAVKLTNLFILLPLIVIGLVIHRKDLSLKNILAALAPAFAILSIFVLFAWISVGNPFYPYYNWIFKGPYASAVKYSWDARWGPQNLLETIFWPVINMVKPYYRYSEFGMCSGRLAIGYIFGIILFVSGLFARRLRKLFPLTLVFLLMVLIWSVTAGYCRYAIGIEIFSGLFIFIAVLYLLSIHKQGGISLYRSGAILASVFFGIQFLYAQGIVTYQNLDWKANSTSIFKYELDQIRNQFFYDYADKASLLFTDRGNPAGENAEEIKQELKNVKLWVDVGNGNTLYPTLLKPEAPIYVDNTMFDAETRDQARDNLFSQYKDGIYGFDYSVQGEGYAVAAYKDMGLAVEKSIGFQVDFLPSGQEIIMYKLIPYTAKITDGTIKPLANNEISLFKNRSEQLFDYWSSGLAEQDDDGLWTAGQEVKIPLYLSDISQDNVLKITASAFGQQQVTVLIDGQELGTYTFTEETSTIEVPFTKELLSDNNILELEFKIPTATVRPIDTGISEDTRYLGIKLYQIKIVPGNTDTVAKS